MKFVSVNYQNFGPFAKAELALADRGLVLIQGDNRINASADSNGSGKSMLLEGIVWCLFGKTIRYDLKGVRTSEQVVRRAAGKDCFVETLIDAGGQLIRIIRYRKHKTGKNSVQLFVDGVDKTLGGNEETTKLIAETLGIDFSAFTRSVYFDGSKIVAFPTLPDSEIKAVFEKVLGLDDLSKVNEVVKRRKQEKAGLIDSKNREIAFANSELSTAAVEYEQAKGKSERFAGEKATKREAKEKELEGYERVQRAQTPIPATLDTEEMYIKGDVAKREKEIAELSVVDEVIAANERKIAEAAGKIGTLQGTIDAENRRFREARATPETVSAIAVAKNARDTLNGQWYAAGEASRNAASKIGHPCGECGKLYTQDDLGHIAEHQSKLADDLKRQVAECSTRITNLEQQAQMEITQFQQACQTRYTEINAEILKVRAHQDSLVAKRAKFQTIVEKREELRRANAEAPAALAKIAAIRADIAALAGSIERVKREIAEIAAAADPYADDMNRWAGRQGELHTKINTFELELGALQSDLDMLALMEKAYGRQGLKAHVLETITPILNERANDYARQLADGTVKITFSTVTQNKDGSLAEKFSVTVDNDQGSEAYLGNSSGEQRKIDLAIALAMSDLVAARSSRPIDLWVADEIAESLDPTAVERVVELLRDKAKERGTLLTISHVDMSSYIPQVITVRKEAAGSSLV